MSVGILIITHNNIGEQLLETARIMLGTCPLEAANLAIQSDCDLDSSIAEAESLIKNIEHGDGVLVLTDMYGSTPSNIATRLANSDSVTVISGVNLPMLIRILNYPRLNLEQLAQKACSGGHDGIMVCK